MTHLNSLAVYARVHVFSLNSKITLTVELINKARLVNPKDEEFSKSVVNVSPGDLNLIFLVIISESVVAVFGVVLNVVVDVVLVKVAKVVVEVVKELVKTDIDRPFVVEAGIKTVDLGVFVIVVDNDGDVVERLGHTVGGLAVRVF